MSTDSQVAPKCVRPAEAARLLGVCWDTVYVLMLSGQLRSVRVDRARLIPISALDDLLLGGSYQS